MKDLSVIILTFNETKHIKRCIDSLKKITDNILVIDSFSTDDTIQIAESCGAKVLQNKWINYSEQFRFGLNNNPFNTRWVMRMDADEYLTEEVISEINTKAQEFDNDSDLTGVYIKRRVYFMDKWIRYGGYYPIKLLRIWRYEAGNIEQKWHDEHIYVKYGNTVELKHDLVDDNLNDLTWWTEKHNRYASIESIDLLNKVYSFFQTDDSIHSQNNKNTQTQKKRWYKDNLYARSPLFLRAFLYFLFRYFIQLGFLDGKKGLVWHFLQGFWYRFLVDAKIYQVKYLAKKNNQSIVKVLEDNFNFKV